jgi:DNA-binding NtrC family response regulator
MNRRVLVVDDDRAMVSTLADVLRFKGWTVTPAYSGMEAVNAVAREDFDAIVMDFKMPGMDGVSAFRAIRSFRPTLPVVLMSAYIAHEVVAQAEREGVTRVLPKPIDLNALIALLSDGVSRQRPVLLVDSESVFLRSLAELLTLRGYETVTCDTVAQAMSAMTQRPPMAVLLHLDPGSGNAAELAMALRRMSPSAQLLLYSGRPEADAEARNTVPSDWRYTFLQKPFAVEQVTALLERAGRAIAERRTPRPRNFTA